MRAVARAIPGGTALLILVSTISDEIGLASLEMSTQHPRTTLLSHERCKLTSEEENHDLSCDALHETHGGRRLRMSRGFNGACRGCSAACCCASPRSGRRAFQSAAVIAPDV